MKDFLICFLLPVCYYVIMYALCKKNRGKLSGRCVSFGTGVLFITLISDRDWSTKLYEMIAAVLGIALCFLFDHFFNKRCTSRWRHQMRQITIEYISLLHCPVLLFSLYNQFVLWLWNVISTKPLLQSDA